jgi:hypothetical protein
MAMLVIDAETRMTGRAFLHCFKYLLKFLYESSNSDVTPFDREWIQNVLDQNYERAKAATNNNVVDWIWATPGFTSFLLDPMLYSSSSMDPASAAGQRLLPDAYCYAIACFLTGTSVTNVGGRSVLNNNRVTVGYLRFMMQLWSKEQIRQSFPSEYRWECFNASLACLMSNDVHDSPHQSRIAEATGPKEFLPGISVRDMVEILIDDIYYFARVIVNGLDTHRFFQNIAYVITPNCWSEEGLSTDERIELLEILLRSQILKDSYVDKFKYGYFEYETVRFSAVSYILNMLIVSLKTSNLFKLYYAAKEQNRQVNIHVVEMLRFGRKQCLQASKPHVQRWTNYVHDRLRRLNLPQQHLPSDITDLIAEFASPCDISHHSTINPSFLSSGTEF